MDSISIEVTGSTYDVTIRMSSTHVDSNSLTNFDVIKTALENTASDVLGVTTASATVTAEVVAYSAPSPPPPSPPPPSPPPTTCTLDFLRYDLTDYSDPVKPGYDGNLVVEFGETERIAKASISTGLMSTYACAVRSEPTMQCLDVGSPSTLGGSLNVDAFNDGVANIVNNPNLILDLFSSANASATTVLFGQRATCDGKVVGDGMINVFDIAVLMNYIFGEYVYGDENIVSRRPSDVFTVEGRSDLDDYCDTNTTRADFLAQYANSVCAPLSLPPPSAPLGRRLSMASEAFTNMLYREHSPPEVVPRRFYPSRRFSESNQLLRPLVGGRTSVTEATEKLSPLEYNFFRDIHTDQGSRYTLQISSITPAIELRFLQTNLGSARLRNEYITEHTSQETIVGFTRHCEYGTCTQSCATIEGGLDSSTAMYEGTISLRQRPYMKSCGFDIHVWVPASQQVPNLCVDYIVASDAHNGIVSTEKACAYALSDNTIQYPPPSIEGVIASPPPPPTSGPKRRVTTLVVATVFVLGLLCALRARPFQRMLEGTARISVA